MWTEYDIAKLKRDRLSAFRFGYVDEFKNILKLHIKHNMEIEDLEVMLMYAAKNGRLPFIKMLLPFTTPEYCSGTALQSAATHNHIKAVKLLLDHCTNKDELYLAAQMAHVEGHKKIVDLFRSKFDLSMTTSFDVWKISDAASPSNTQDMEDLPDDYNYNYNHNHDEGYDEQDVLQYAQHLPRTGDEQGCQKLVAQMSVGEQAAFAIIKSRPKRKV